MNSITLYEVMTQLQPLMPAALVYGFWYARVNHVLRMREPLYWMGFIIAADLVLHLTAAQSISWVAFIHKRIVTLPYMYLALVVSDALYRHIFPSRITWHAAVSASAIKSQACRFGVIIAFFVATLIATVETQMGISHATDVFGLGLVLGSLVHILAFHGLILLIAGIHFPTQWLVVATLSGFFTSLVLLPHVMAFIVGVMCSVLMSALFWYFGLWPAFIAQVCCALALDAPMHQGELSIILGVIALVMVWAHFFTKPTYLSIGAFSKTKFPAAVLQQRLIPWDIPRGILVVSIMVLAVALKFSEKSINLVADSLQTPYAAIIEKAKTLVLEREGKQQKHMKYVARRYPVKLEEVSAMGRMYPDKWQRLTPAFISWGCWQVVAQKPLTDHRQVYEMVICEGARWNQFFVHGANDLAQRASTRAAVIEKAMQAIQDDLNIAPQSLMFTYAQADTNLPEGTRWRVRYDIKDYLIEDDVGLYAQVIWSNGQKQSVHFLMDIPEADQRLWAFFHSLQIPQMPIMIILATALCLCYSMGRKLQDYLRPSLQSMAGFVMLAVGLLAFHSQVLLEKYMDKLLLNPGQEVLWYHLPLPMILVISFIVWVSLRGAYEIISSQPSLSLKGHLVSSAFGSTVWVLLMLVGYYQHDQGLDVLKMWPSFLFDPVWQFPSIVMLATSLIIIVITVWAHFLVNSHALRRIMAFFPIFTAMIYFCVTPIQAVVILVWPLLLQKPFFFLISRLGLRAVVPMVVAPILFWVSWILPTSRPEVFSGGIIASVMLTITLLLWHIIERKRQVR